MQLSPSTLHPSLISTFQLQNLIPLPPDVKLWHGKRLVTIACDKKKKRKKKDIEDGNRGCMPLYIFYFLNKNLL
jgi:hypothetical protein